MVMRGRGNMRNNYRRMIALRIETLNHLSYAPHAGQYRVDNNGIYHAVHVGDEERVSSYLTLPVLWEWIDGYMTALRQVHETGMKVSHGR